MDSAAPLPRNFITGPSGGFSYHLTALRHRQHRWAPFIQFTERWLLHDWNPSASELIIFGPSAGWTLSEDFLARFEKVTLIEPDAVAQWIARARFRRLRNLEWSADVSLLPPFTGRTETRAHLQRFLDRRPRAAILFSNLLGQLALLNDNRISESAMARANHDLRAALDGRTWASYHDVLSSSAPWRGDAPLSIEARGEDSLEEVALRFFPAGCEALTHMTDWIGSPRFYAGWDLRPSRRHVIGFVSSPTG